AALKDRMGLESDEVLDPDFQEAIDREMDHRKRAAQKESDRRRKRSGERADDLLADAGERTDDPDEVPARRSTLDDLLGALKGAGLPGAGAAQGALGAAGGLGGAGGLLAAGGIAGAGIAVGQMLEKKVEEFEQKILGQFETASK